MGNSKRESYQVPSDKRNKKFAIAIHVAEILAEGGIHAKAMRDGSVRVYNAPLSVEVIWARSLPMASLMLDRYYELVAEIPKTHRSPIVVGHSWFRGVRQTMAMLPLRTLVQMIGEKK